MSERTITEQQYRIAVIADAHLHDIEADYEFEGITLNEKQLTLRSWSDTRRSSRVFNESKSALLFALQDVIRRGIKIVVLLGDYTDDGQMESTRCVRQILLEHEQQHGLQFFAITGNHDAFALHGKHQSTRFSSNSGHTVLVSSDPKVASEEPDTAVLTRHMYCDNVANGVEQMSGFGLDNVKNYLHWETPFGLDDATKARVYCAQSQDGNNQHTLIDASYLVEPIESLWLLMIDANVFEPRNGNVNAKSKKAFIDSSDAGWNAVFSQRPHLLPWMHDVSRRAIESNRTLLVFSHYPVVDPFSTTSDAAFALFGNYDMHRRKPAKRVAEQFIDAGLHTHFSGHLHINAQTRFSHTPHILVDHAVPSLVAFPAGYKVVNTTTGTQDIDNITIHPMPLDTHLIKQYQREQTQHDDTDALALGASNYGEFLYHRMHLRVKHHYLSKDWPHDIAKAITNTSLADLAMLLSAPDAEPADLTLHRTDSKSQRIQLEPLQQLHALSIRDLTECSVTTLVADWYCLRHAGVQTYQYIKPGHLQLYKSLCNTFPEPRNADATTHVGFFSRFVVLLACTLREVDESTD